MKLQLLSADMAGVFGLPAEDSTVEDLVSYLQAQGWAERAAREHVDAAIRAGAYAPHTEERDVADQG